MAPLIRLVDVPGRVVWYVAGTAPACFLLVDDRAGGILVNSPRFSAGVAEAVERVARARFIFYPSRFGAVDVVQWRTATGARTVASAAEAADIPGPVDEAVDAGVRIHGRLDFLPLSGRTRGTCALRSRALPGIVFFGPALEHTPWPTLVLHEDDSSAENRLIGALGLREERFEFAFCDNFVEGVSAFGGGASAVVAAGLAEVLGA